MDNIRPENFLGIALAEAISIQDFLKKMSIHFPDECTYLLSRGQEYSDVLQAHPRELPGSKFCQSDQCHRNTMLYLLQLKKANVNAIEQIRFATGFARAMIIPGTENSMPPCVITRHSFLLYKKLVYDITYLNYPPTYYKVDQYFGVDFHADLMDIPWDFEVKRGYYLGVIDFVMQKGEPFIS